MTNDQIKHLLNSFIIDFGITEKEFLMWCRNSIRHSWMNSPAKRDFMNKKSIMVKNENQKSMKKYPFIKKAKCQMCGELFSIADVELDHVNGNNSLKKIDDIIPFTKNILFPESNGLQILCKDKVYKRNIKNNHIGCHSIKTYAERHNISLQDAKISKYAIDIVKKKLDNEYIRENGLIPEKSASKRRLQIEQILRSKL